MSEKLLAYHCAPALAGIKPANIISLQKTKDIFNDITDLNLSLNKIGIYIEILCECTSRVLIMVYRRKKLIEYLSRPEIFDFLLSVGYPKENNLNTYITYLKKRLSESCNFPHEIGAFLGYPICDIYGFINHKKALYTGYWKVYDNAEETKKMFKRFDNCRNALCKRIASGQSIIEIFGAA